MPAKEEASRGRSVQAEVEVSGTPGEVWQAIASGPGVSSWFLPTKMDGRVGGTVTRFGPLNSVHSVAKITAWEPPERFVVKSDPGAVSTQWTIKANAGGTCTVRVVDSWFSHADDWFDQFPPDVGSLLFARLASLSGAFPGTAVLARLPDGDVNPVNGEGLGSVD
jgi:uncharacterized protein YndB with AHSA1/START domain